MDSLLNEKDRYKILLLTLFNLQESRDFTVSYFEEWLGISKYKITNILEELTIEMTKDKAEFPDIDLLIEEDNLIWKNVGNDYIQYKRRQYLEYSEKFELFQYVFIDNKKITDFMEDKFVSRKKAYKIRAELNEFLSRFGVSVDSSKFQGDEKNIRNVAYQIYYGFFSEDDVPFSEETNVYIDNLIYAMRKTGAFNKERLAPSQIKKIRFFLGVIHIRLNNNFYIEQEPSITEEGNKALKSAFSKIHNITNTDYLSDKFNVLPEEYYFYQFLRLNISGIDLPRIENNVNEDVTTTVYRFFETLKSYDFFNEVSEESQADLYSRIFKINERLYEFPWVPITFNMAQQQIYFEENFYIFHNLVTYFIENTRFYSKMKLSDLELNGLYYDYMFSLIKCLPLDKIYQDVNVYVDFSRGDLYTDYIIKNISSYRDLNIAIQTEINRDTDIIVSDFKVKNVKCQQVVWKNPPSPTDWRMFADVVLNIKKDKVI